jgi:hypothetical protein
MSVAGGLASGLGEVTGGLSGRVATALVVGSLFLSEAASAFYSGVGRPLPDAFPLLNSVCMAMSIIAWFRVYSQRRGIPWVVDMDWFLLGAWVILVPYYVLKVERRRGLGRIGLFCLTYFAAWASGTALRIWLRVLTAA